MDSIAGTYPEIPLSGGSQHIDSVASLDFTHVFYNSKDWISFLFAWISLTPQALLVIYATLITSRREAETILLLGGQVGCELVNNYLKRVVKEERPKCKFCFFSIFYFIYVLRLLTITDGDGYGMPSAHAQFMSFYATYICLWMLFRVRHFSNRKKLLRSVSLITLAGLVAYSRVYLHYHSGLQVIAGVVIGIICGIAYFMGVVLIRDLGIVDLLLDTPPARWFYIKDTAGETASFVRDEYAEWRRSRMKMKLLVKIE